MKTELFEKISHLLHPILDPLKAFLVDMNMRGEDGSSVLEIFADTDAGITADQCAEISRKLSVEIEGQNILTGRYRLEVSSPGLDRPLKLGRQFVKNIGRQVRIVTSSGGETVEGGLESVTEGSVTLLTQEKSSVTIELKDIQEAYVLPRFKRV